MAHYIASSDITDKIVAEFVTKSDSRISAWMTRVDDEIKFVGESLGVLPSDFVWVGDDDTTDATLMHPKILDYARTYFCLIVCEDNIGAASNNPVQDDLYVVKMKIYQDKLKELRQQLSADMFWEGDEELEQIETVGQGGTLYRG